MTGWNLPRGFEEMVCPHCGEGLLTDQSGEGLDICPEHGCVEDPGGLSFSDYEDQVRREEEEEQAEWYRERAAQDARDADAHLEAAYEEMQGRDE
jgi:uncharacterized Zn finger protein (UPF0148 family)